MMCTDSIIVNWNVVVVTQNIIQADGSLIKTGYFILLNTIAEYNIYAL